VYKFPRTRKQITTSLQHHLSSNQYNPHTH